MHLIFKDNVEFCLYGVCRDGNCYSEQYTCTQIGIFANLYIFGILVRDETWLTHYLMFVSVAPIFAQN